MVTFVRCLEDFECLLKAETIDALLLQSQKLVAALGFEFFLYVMKLQTLVEDSTEFVLNGYLPDWQAMYTREQFNKIDPIVAHCAASMLPVIWAPAHYVTPEQKRLQRESVRCGVRSGLSIPLHGGQREIGMLSLASGNRYDQKEVKRMQEVLPECHMLGVFMHEAVRHFVAPKKCPQSVPKLTVREVECLKWVANGKTSWETASILNCTERTVNFHMGNVIQKLDVNNRRQAVVKAMCLNLIAV